MPIQNNIQIQLASPGRMNSLPDRTRELLTTQQLIIIPSVTGTFEEIYYCDKDGNRLMFLGRFSIAAEFDPSQDAIARRINPGPSILPGNVPYLSMATPLVKFVASTTDKKYCVIIKVLPEYVFANPEHDFLRFTLQIDGRNRAVRTVSARQIAEVGGNRPWIVVIDGQGDEENFMWKAIKISDDDHDDPEDHSDWNYNLGTIRVLVERCREEGGERGEEDAGGMVVGGDEEDDEKEKGGEAAASASGRVEDEEAEKEKEDARVGASFPGGLGVEEGEVEEVEASEEEEEEEEEDDDEDDDSLSMHQLNVEERHLSHYTIIRNAQKSMPVPGAAAAAAAISGLCVDPEPFLIFDFKYRSSALLPDVAGMPQ